MGKRKYFLRLVFSASLGYMLHFPLRFAEDVFMGWLQTFISERWGVMTPMLQWLLNNFIDWILPFILAIIIVWFIYWLARRERKITTTSDKHDEDQKPFKLIDSFPKDNDTITTEDVKSIYLKFNKPIDKDTAGLIQNYFVKQNMYCQWNIGGWIQYAEDDTKLIWHVKENSLQNKDQFGPMDFDYPTFEIHIGHAPEDARLKATDGSKLPRTIIKVKIQQPKGEQDSKIVPVMPQNVGKSPLEDIKSDLLYLNKYQREAASKRSKQVCPKEVAMRIHDDFFLIFDVNVVISIFEKFIAKDIDPLIDFFKKFGDIVDGNEYGLKVEIRRY